MGGGSADTDAYMGGMRMVGNGDSFILVHLPNHAAHARVTD